MTDTIDRSAIVRAEMARFIHPHAIIADKEFDYGARIVIECHEGRYDMYRGFMLNDTQAGVSCDVRSGRGEEVMNFLLDLVVI